MADYGQRDRPAPPQRYPDTEFRTQGPGTEPVGVAPSGRSITEGQCRVNRLGRTERRHRVNSHTGPSLRSAQALSPGALVVQWRVGPGTDKTGRPAGTPHPPSPTPVSSASALHHTHLGASFTHAVVDGLSSRPIGVPGGGAGSWKTGSGSMPRGCEELFEAGCGDAVRPGAGSSAGAGMEVHHALRGRCRWNRDLASHRRWRSRPVQPAVEDGDGAWASSAVGAGSVASERRGMPGPPGRPGRDRQAPARRPVRSRRAPTVMHITGVARRGLARPSPRLRAKRADRGRRPFLAGCRTRCGVTRERISRTATGMLRSQRLHYSHNPVRTERM